MQTLDPALAERLSNMSPAKRALYLRSVGLSPDVAQRLLATTDRAGIPSRDPAAPVPMSFAQELLWRLERASPGFTYNVPKATRFRGPLNLTALQRAIDGLVDRHEILRTTFDLVDGAPRQIVLETVSVPVDVVDLTSLSAAERESEAHRIVRDRSRRPFDLAHDLQLRVTLVRLDEDDHVLLIESHHIASDVVSRSIQFRELHALYREALGGAPAALPPLRTQYADFAAWQRNHLVGDRLEKLLAYWREQLDGARALELPTDHRAPAYSTEGALATRLFAPALLDGLRRLNATHGTTLFMALLAGVDVLLARYSHQNDVVVGAPIAGRPHADLEGVIGYFVNTLVLRTSLEGDPSFAELLARTRATSLAAFEHQDVPYELMLTALAESGRIGAGPLFNVMLSMLDGEARPVPLEGTQVVPFAANRGAAKFDLSFAFHEHADGLRASIEYRSELFDAATIERMLAHLETLLTAAVAAPDTRVNSLPLLDADERGLILGEWAGPATSYPRDATVHELFAEIAAARSNAVALVSGRTSLTYGELAARAAALAEQLRAAGVGPGTLVGLSAERSIGLVVAMLAILEVGGAFVPLDPEYPEERLGFMLEDIGARVVLAQSSVVLLIERAALRSGGAARVLAIGADGLLVAPAAAPSGESPPNGAIVSARSPAYVMYTSGSTGRPKGVVVPHQAIVRLVRNTNYLRLTSDDVVLGFAPSAFDASTLEIWGALLNGARLVLAPSGVLDLSGLADLVQDSGITVAWLTAGLFQQVVDGGLERYGGLRALLAGGDVLSVPRVRRALVDLPRCTLINGYGPTENTTFTCCYEIPHDWPADTAVPIGRPIANTRVYILDSQQQPVPIGVPGELYAGGDGVALGYLDRPELTAERFLPDPFVDRIGATMYRTGDRARWRGDGVIEFLGRFDEQVKIRGFRIEPGEIENALAAHPGIRQAAVVAQEGRDAVQLVGYYVPAEGAASLTTAALRGYLRERLPEYMVPAFLVPLDAIPLTANGKLDRKNLPAPQVGETGSTYVAPRTTLEHQFVGIWQQLLDTRTIGIRDNFFDIGGHSLLAVRMLSEIEQISGRRLPLASLFENGTIERLAALAESAVTSEEEPPLVVLPSAQGARPFIFAHGDVRGGGWYCRRLAQLLGPDTQMVVMPTLRPTGPTDPRTLEALAALHVAEIRKVQPHGPYRIGGYCFGGVIAFEMAQQLHDAGEVVERLVLVDSSLRNAPFRAWRPLIDLVLPLRADRLQRRADWLGRVGALRRKSSAERWEWVRRNVAKRLPWTRRAAEARTPEEPRQTDEIWTRPGSDVIRFEARAAGGYVPRSYAGAIDLVVAVERPEVADVDYGATMGSQQPARSARVGSRGWEYVTGDVRIYPVSATHVGLITSALEVFGARLHELLAGGAQGTNEKSHA